MEHISTTTNRPSLVTISVADGVLQTPRAIQKAQEVLKQHNPSCGHYFQAEEVGQQAHLLAQLKQLTAELTALDEEDRKHCSIVSQPPKKNGLWDFLTATIGRLVSGLRVLSTTPGVLKQLGEKTTEFGESRQNPPSVPLPGEEGWETVSLDDDD